MSDELKPIVLTFGYGINRRSRPQDIDEQECFDGENFDLSHQFFALHRRDSFSLVSIAPNGQEIRGYAQLVNRDGSVSTLIQAGGTVYLFAYSDTTGWTWTSVGTVLPTARLRGPRSHNWLLDQYVIITDLEKIETVKKWDGTTFGNFVHNLTSDLKAKFCRVHGERAYIGNVTTTTDTPHVILASELDDAANLTVANRPASSLSDADPFFLPTPDLRPINGIEKGFGQLFFSTTNGQLHRLSGASAKDFELISFYEGSAVSGDEALVNIGNDILMGLEGRIETLSGTLNFGDVETDDASQWIRPLVENVREWRIAYNRRLQKVYCIPDSGGLVWVLHKPLLNEVGVKFENVKSPWSKWTTQHDIAFSPSTLWSMICPCSNLERTFFGDQSGRLFALEGSSGQDGAGQGFIPSAYDTVDTDVMLVKNSALSGIADSATGSFSIWIKINSGDLVKNIIHASETVSEDTPFALIYSTSVVAHAGYRKFAVTVKDAALATFFFFRTVGTYGPSDGWIHILGSYNTNFAAGLKLGSLYINDVSDSAIISDANAAFSAGLTVANQWSIAEPTEAAGFQGCFSQAWFSTEYIDFSVEANRRKFIDANGKPVYLGSDGGEPTGTPPLIFINNVPTRAEINAGTGGDFTQNNDIIPCESNPTGVGNGTGGGLPANINVFRRSKIINLPGFDLFDIKGWITYLKSFPATVTLTFEYGGTNVFDQSITVQLPANPIMGVYNGDAYYNGEFYYNAGFEGRLKRQKFSAAGQASFCQVKIEVSGAEDVEIHEIGLWFTVAKDN